MCPKLCNKFIYFEFLTFTVLWVHRQIVLEKGVASLLAQRRTSQQRRRQETGLIAELDSEFESHWISLTKMCRIQRKRSISRFTFIPFQCSKPETQGKLLNNKSCVCKIRAAAKIWLSWFILLDRVYTGTIYDCLLYNLQVHSLFSFCV